MKRTYLMTASAACIASVAMILCPEPVLAQRGGKDGREGGRSGNVSRGDSGRGGSSNRSSSGGRGGNVSRSQPGRTVGPNTSNRGGASGTVRTPTVRTPSVRTPTVRTPTVNPNITNRDGRGDSQRRVAPTPSRDTVRGGNVVNRPDRDWNRNDWNDWNRDRNDRDRNRDWADANRNRNDWNRNDWNRNDWDRDRNDWNRNNWSRNRWSNPYAGSNWGTPNYWNRYYRSGNYGNPFFGYGGYNRYPYNGYGGYGLGGWLPGIGIGLGIGRLFGGGSGYGGYGYNPGYYDGNYYTGYRGTYVDDTDTTVVQEQPVEAIADGDFLGSARSAFQSGDYARAQRLANHAIVDDPENAKAHELMSLALFAQGNFGGAAEAAHATVAMGSVADWPTLYGYYNDRAKYEEHFNALKQFAAEKPQATEGHFLLGYHHLMMGHQDSARTELAQYLRLVDHQDPIGIQLYGKAGGNVDALPKPTAPPPGAQAPAAPEGSEDDAL